MRFRHEKPNIDPRDEERLTAELRNLSGAEISPKAPPDMYWPNLLVRTNSRIDDASSGKAMSFSWAARVAIPGVVAVLSFLIGLQYYVPSQPKDRDVASVVRSLQGQEIDSLLTVGASSATEAVDTDIASNVLALSRDQLAEYMLARGELAEVLNAVPDHQSGMILAALGSAER
jgi:hypothetical protein